ncbi:hypothetical protein J3459_003912 [Metarhizium acridum]|nr:hypothetical protein J3459_003912 [Metarhizium acridum]
MVHKRRKDISLSLSNLAHQVQNHHERGSVARPKQVPSQWNQFGGNLLEDMREASVYITHLDSVERSRIQDQTVEESLDSTPKSAKSLPNAISSSSQINLKHT